jgi:UPF0755 protein
MTGPRAPRPYRRTAWGAALAAVAVALLCALLLFDTAPPPDWQDRKVTVPRGSRLPEVVSALREGGVLRRPLVFRALVYLTLTSRRLHYGEYTFSRPPSTFEVWRKVYHGDVVTYRVTVPPGANLYDVAALLNEHSLAEPEAFLAAATSPAELERLEIPGGSAEGYLYPETYTLVKTVTPEEILEDMVRMFRKRFTPEMERKAKASGFSLHQVVTIASIIEKETGIDGEKPLVSAVIRRRLALGMPLQMDPTVIYGVRRFDGTVTRKDLRTPGPYNTYTSRGLPPGPIANPGMPALEAALTPADADYLYFVSRNDGSHTFSRTLEEHNRAVEAFRRVAREAEG